MEVILIGNGSLGSYLETIVFASPYGLGSPAASMKQLMTVNEEYARLISALYATGEVSHINSLAYDYYSVQDLLEQKPAKQWLTFPLPGENMTGAWIPKGHNRTTIPMVISPPTISGLAYVEQIYVMTDPSLTDRHDNIKNAFRRQNIPLDSIKWQLKWNRTECNSKKNKEEVFRHLNLVDEPASKLRSLVLSLCIHLISFVTFSEGHDRYCSLIMKSIDSWKDTAKRNLSLALYLEDDAIFVPYFKEKFNRFVYTAIRTGALKVDGSCASNSLPKNSTEWVNQDPTFVIGSCLGFLDPSFDLKQPMLSTHKSSPTRCAHAYLFNSCSAVAVIKQISANKNELWTPDFYLNNIIPPSPTLQSFWLDPPLVYQGNKARDLDKIPSFQRKTY